MTLRFHARKADGEWGSSDEPPTATLEINPAATFAELRKQINIHCPVYFSPLSPFVASLKRVLHGDNCKVLSLTSSQTEQLYPGAYEIQVFLGPYGAHDRHD